MPLHPQFSSWFWILQLHALRQVLLNSMSTKSYNHSSTIGKRHVPCIFNSWEVATELKLACHSRTCSNPCQNPASCLTATLRQCSSKLRLKSWIPKPGSYDFGREQHFKPSLLSTSHWFFSDHTNPWHFESLGSLSKDPTKAMTTLSWVTLLGEFQLAWSTGSYKHRLLLRAYLLTAHCFVQQRQNHPKPFFNVSRTSLVTWCNLM